MRRRSTRAPIRIIVPFAAGGGGDLSARIVAQPLSQALGQPVIVETRPGGDGQVAALETLRAAPDGHTIFAASASAMAAVPALRKVAPYDPLADFTPISSFFDSSFFVFVHPSVPVRSLGELFDHARANPGKLNYGSGTMFSVIQHGAGAAADWHEHGACSYIWRGAGGADFIIGRIQVMLATPP
jgi:tripartite-type tricarboxylate transporter receptor subunit TctC